MKVTVLDKKTGQQKTMSSAHARVLTKIGRAQYLTRDMVAAPAQADEDLDLEGVVWDEKIHVSTKLKNTDGTWRKRPGSRSTA